MQVEDKHIVVIEPKETFIKWAIKGLPLWFAEDINYELSASYRFLLQQKKIDEKLRNYYNISLKGRSADKCIITQDYRLENKVRYTALWAKTLKKECDYSSKNFYLIGHSPMPDTWIDGVYRRYDCMHILERCLMRWKYLSNQVVIATPFIGFPYQTPNKQKEVLALWEWLDELLDMTKTTVITRRSAYTLWKKNWDSIDDIKIDDLRTLGLFDPLLAEADANRLHFKQNFHAKFYAGIFDDRVEVMSGSYNLHTGMYYDQIAVRSYSKDFFMEYFMKPLYPEFDYKKTNGEVVYSLEIDGRGKIRDSEVNIKHFC